MCPTYLGCATQKLIFSDGKEIFYLSLKEQSLPKCQPPIWDSIRYMDFSFWSHRFLKFLTWRVCWNTFILLGCLKKGFMSSLLTPRVAKRLISSDAKKLTRRNHSQNRLRKSVCLSFPTADPAKRLLAKRGTSKVKPEVMMVNIYWGHGSRYLGDRAARSHRHRSLPYDSLKSVQPNTLSATWETFFFNHINSTE